jgi:hypothetical protein
MLWKAKAEALVTNVLAPLSITDFMESLCFVYLLWY